MAKDQIVECVPNFSEGRDKSVIDAIARSISSVAGVSLLDVDPGADTNRTVYTFVGAPQAVADAALAASKTASTLIDMKKHHGAHPRMGALDVCPFVPVSNMSMDECVELSKRFGAALASELGVPVYLYEASASRPERRSLADIRSGEYEGLEAKLADPEWKPDFGPASFVPSWGATVTGAREFLIAYNVNLNTKDKKLAGEIALTIREGGRSLKDAAGNIVRDKDGNAVKKPGLLKEVRAIGWYIDSYRLAQVSINLLNYKVTPLWKVYETVKSEAEKLGLYAVGSELVGLIPLDPLLETGRHYLKKAGKSEGASERELIETAVRSLGLDSVGPFDPAKKVVEYAAAAALSSGAPKLINMQVDAFADEVASDSPAPGGGSVAALAGSLGAALASMAANLTVGKKGYEKNWETMSALAVEAQGIKAELLRAVDTDTDAFSGLMAAMRMPKSTAEEKSARAAAIEAGYQHASEVPLETARTCLRALKLAHRAAGESNANSISDAGVGALMARTGVEGAVLNVLINLGNVQDRAFASRLKAEAEALLAEAEAEEKAAVGLVRKAIG